MELVIYKPTEDQFVKSIDFNFDELKQEMTAALAKYNGLVYTDESIKDAKSDRATLNKFKDALENKRKEIKKQCLEPYEAFEKKIKELTALVDKPILAIDAQVKSFEQAQKDEKRSFIFEFYNDHIGDLAALLSFDKVFNEKWLNTTAKIAEAQDSILHTIDRVSSDLKTIADLKSEFELQIKDTYLQTLDLSSALGEKTRLEQQKSKMAEYEARQAALEALRKSDESKTIVVNGDTDLRDARPGDHIVFGGDPVTAEPNQETPILYEQPAQECKTIKVVFYDTTEAFRHDMKDLTEKHNIKYGGIR